MDPVYLTAEQLLAIFPSGTTFERDGNTVYFCIDGARTPKSWTKPS